MYTYNKHYGILSQQRISQYIQIPKPNVTLFFPFVSEFGSHHSRTTDPSLFFFFFSGLWTSGFIHDFIAGSTLLLLLLILVIIINLYQSQVFAPFFWNVFVMGQWWWNKQVCLFLKQTHSLHFKLQYSSTCLEFP